MLKLQLEQLQGLYNNKSNNDNKKYQLDSENFNEKLNDTLEELIKNKKHNRKNS